MFNFVNRPDWQIATDQQLVKETAKVWHDWRPGVARDHRLAALSAMRRTLTEIRNLPCTSDR